MKTYLEISISVNKNKQELLIPTMIELGCHGFSETDSELLCYMDKSLWSEDKLINLKSEIKRILQTISSNFDIKFKEIQEENWNRQWESTIKPIEIGERLVVKPTWADYDNITNRIIIQIDPKMSFGTGYHETTRLTLQLLEKYLKNDYDVLDVGTGTGILAIAAVKLGAKNATGIDNDEWSISNAKENANANELNNKVVISKKPLSDFGDYKYNLITANIMLNTILELLPEMIKRLNDSGIIIFSGLLIQDENSFFEGIAKYDLKILDKINEGEWLAFAACL